MDRRLKLHQELVEILGSNNVYFQPPASLVMKYPCIVYNRDGINPQFASNKPYKLSKEYSVTVIDRKPDSKIAEQLAELPTCRHTSYFVSDNLNHDVFTLYY